MLNSSIIVRVSTIVFLCLLILPTFSTNIFLNVTDAIIAAEEHHIDVPFYYQVNTYYCGPAALQMVFDYFGENVSQFEIAEVARTVPYVTYTDELRRAAHFSNISTSMGSEMTENITGYTLRKLGYATFEMWGMTLDELKALIDRDFPVVLLMRWIPGKEYGHYRVAVGYNATHVFLHDPWNNIEWGGEYGGPNLPMNYTFFNEMWDYSGQWGLFVSPWIVRIAMPNNVYVGQKFTVQATIGYVCPPLNYSFNYEASPCKATITLPEGLSLPEGEPYVNDLGDIPAGGIVQTSWVVKADNPGNYTVSIEAEGKITGFVTEKPDVGPSYSYIDRIGGCGSGFVNAEIPSHIYIESVNPTEGTPGTSVVIQGGGATPNGTVVSLLSGPVNQTIVIMGAKSAEIQENVTIVVNMTIGWTIANSNGFWSIPFTVPNVSPGEYNIFVEDNNTQTSDSTTFYVLQLTPVQIKIENISPKEGYPGTFVSIIGHGATPKGEVKIYLNRLNVANTNAYDDGGWYASFKVPDVAPGNHTVLAFDVSSGTSDSTVFRVLEMEIRSVGVKEGDWAKYSVVFNYSTNDPNPPITYPENMLTDIDYLLIKIVSVVGTNVTYETVIRYKNGTEIKSSSWLDISTGLSYPGFPMSYGPIIAANLTAGDKVYLNAYAATINSTLMAFYAGSVREVNCFLQEVNMTIPSIPPKYRIFGKAAIYWDRLSGILCEQKIEEHYINIANGYETNLLLQVVITETNIWTAPTGVNVKIKFCPHTLNLKSKGKWVICQIELPRGYKAGDVDFSTITLNETIKGYVVNKAKGCRVLIVKFDRKVVIDLIKQELPNIRKFGKVTLEVAGKLVDGTPFSGTTKIKIVWKIQNHRHRICPSKFTNFKQAEMFHTKIKEDRHSRLDDPPQSKQDNSHNINHKRQESVERVRNEKS